MRLARRGGPVAPGSGGGGGAPRVFYMVDMSSFTPRLAARVAAVESGAREGPMAAAHEYAREMRALAPVRSGRYRDSISAHQSEGGSAVVGPTAPHAHYVETGRGEVVPVNAKALRFDDGTFAKYAGPTPGHHVVARAYGRATNRAVGAAKSAVTRRVMLLG